MTQKNKWILLESDDQLPAEEYFHVYAVYEDGAIAGVGKLVYSCRETVLQCGGISLWASGRPYNSDCKEIYIQKIPKPDPPAILDLTERERRILETINRFNSSPSSQCSYSVMKLIKTIKSILTGGAE